MRAFKSILKMNLKREFAYKAAAFSGAITQFFFGEGLGRKVGCRSGWVKLNYLILHL